MTTWKDIHNTARAKFASLAGAQGWTVLWPNAPNQTVPDGFHVAYAMIPGESSQQTLGDTSARRFRHVGIIQVSIYDDLENGEARIHEAADTVKVEFQAQTVGGITYRTPSHSVIGVDGAHFGIAVTIPFYSDEVA